MIPFVSRSFFSLTKRNFISYELKFQPCSWAHDKWRHSQSALKFRDENSTFYGKIVDFIDPIPKFYFSWSNKILFSQTESRGDESIVSFSFLFGQMCWRVRINGARISTSFSWFAKVCQVLYVYFAFIPSHNIDFAENGRIFRSYNRKKKLSVGRWRCYQNVMLFCRQWRGNASMHFQ